MAQDVAALGSDFETVLRHGADVQDLVASARSEMALKVRRCYISGSRRSSSADLALSNIRHDLFTCVVGVDELELA